MLGTISPDARILLATRMLRLFSYGLVSVVLVVYLWTVGLDGNEIGWLLSLTLLGDAAISLVISTRADQAGRREMLKLGALLMFAAGLAFCVSRNFIVLTIAATLGVISPSGYEVGPFLSLEQAAIGEVISSERRVQVLAWYNLAGSFATALGALVAGRLVSILRTRTADGVMSYRGVIALYALLAIVMWLLFARLSPSVEARDRHGRGRLGLHSSHGTVFKLSALFALDAFGGGFVIQSVLAFWFHVRFGVGTSALGEIFFWANILAGVSGLLAGRIAGRFGLLNTMVWTHLPSNLLLMLVPFMPTVETAVGVLLLRFSISQMDVPTRQAYVLAVVAPAERSAAGGITGIARTIGSALAPLFLGSQLEHAGTMVLPFLIAGASKSAYDLLLFRNFRKVQLHTEA